MPKSDARLAAIGDVDELNSAVGWALTLVADPRRRADLERIQNELFDLGADLATPGDDFAPTDAALRVTAAQVERLEAEIDRMNEALPPLSSFILPGGSPAVAAVHLARAVARRAERSAVAAAERGVALNPLALVYLNRLSDHLFVLARALAATQGGEVLWRPGATR